MCYQMHDMCDNVMNTTDNDDYYSRVLPGVGYSGRHQLQRQRQMQRADTTSRPSVACIPCGVHDTHDDHCAIRFGESVSNCHAYHLYVLYAEPVGTEIH